MINQSTINHEHSSQNSRYSDDANSARMIVSAQSGTRADRDKVTEVNWSLFRNGTTSTLKQGELEGALTWHSFSSFQHRLSTFSAASIHTRLLK